MEAMKVKDLMVRTEEYVTIDEDATLYDAVMRLEEACFTYEAGRCPHRALLVLDKQGKALGRLSQIDVLRSLEPKYMEMGDLRKLSGFGLSAEFLRSAMDKYELWQSPLADLCRKIMNRKVGDFVRSPLEGEVIDQEASLNQAVHRLVVGHFRSLLVTSKGEFVGILRLVDVFREVTERMKACKI